MESLMRITYFVSDVAIKQNVFLLLKKAIGLYNKMSYLIFKKDLSSANHNKIVTNIKSKLNLELNEYNKNQALELVFKNENQDEVLEVHLQDLIYLQSMGSYVKAYTKQKSGEVRLKIIRNSLINVVNDLDCFVLKNFFACNKSNFINLAYLDSIHFNSGKLFLKLDSIETKISMSRVAYKDLITYSKKTTLLQEQESELATSYQVAY